MLRQEVLDGSPGRTITSRWRTRGAAAAGDDGQCKQGRSEPVVAYFGAHGFLAAQGLAGMAVRWKSFCIWPV